MHQMKALVKSFIYNKNISYFSLCSTSILCLQVNHKHTKNNRKDIKMFVSSIELKI